MRRYDKVYERIMNVICQGLQPNKTFFRDQTEGILKQISTKVFQPLGIDESMWAVVGKSGSEQRQNKTLNIMLSTDAVVGKLGISRTETVMKGRGSAKAQTTQDRKPSDIKKDVIQQITVKLQASGFCNQSEITKGQTSLKFKYALPGFYLSYRNARYQFRNPMLSHQEDNGILVKIEFTNQIGYNRDFFRKYNSGSQYGTDARNLMLQILFKVCSTQAVIQDGYDSPQSFTDDQGTQHFWKVRRMLVNGQGFFSTENTYRSERQGKDRLKNRKQVGRNFVTINPQQALDNVFGQGKYDAGSLNSLQSIWNDILQDPDFQFADKRQQIICGFCADYLFNMEQMGIQNPQEKLPPEMLQWIQANGITEKYLTLAKQKLGRDVSLAKNIVSAIVRECVDLKNRRSIL